MNRILLTLTALLVFAFHVGAQTKPEREAMKLNGPVKTVRDQTIDVSPKDGQPLPDQIKRISSHTFDEQGREIEYAIFEADGPLRVRFVFIRDAQGNAVEENHYDARGNLAEKKFNSYRFDAEGRMLEKISRDSTGAVQQRAVNAYDARGHLTEFSAYDAKGEIITRTLNTYDADGKLQSSSFYTRGGKLASQSVRDKNTGAMTFTYDPDGVFKRLSEEPTKAHEEELDSHGNWTKRTQTAFITRGSGKPEEVIEVTHRTITYY
jgi:hypothetical protein